MQTLLLIEDNDALRENTAEILELSGYQVLTAENGKIGVEVAIREKPDLIICDIMMPVLDGYGVLHMLHKHDDTAHIPFIFLTAKTERNDFRKGMEMGADDYVMKPFEEIELLNAVESRLRKADLTKKHYAPTLEGLDALIRDSGGSSELNKLIENREIRTYRKKEEIYAEGRPSHYLFFLQKGRVKTFKSNELGKELIVDLLAAPTYFGYKSLLQETFYADTAVAMEDAEVCLIPKQDFFMLLNKNVEVAQQFIRMLAENIDEKEDQLIKLAYNSVRKRVADALLRFYESVKANGTTNPGLPLLREDLANAAGTSLETAIRTLSDFKDEKLIDIQSGQVIILSADRLRRMKN
ncbi:response regulator [Arsenicibacter rosenii]|uniref:Transcriptional regulator n=1 Tax=Arsenicibacter rosenii TaxID=1750698 RepID=A0A1S2VDI9_9BACT|nr:response regulator [Arsenicibacter rosenii]OIN56355.1 transcriptional regulator [Arsenicibacter rosenii]